MRLSEFMSEEVETVAPGATIREARELLRRQQVRHLVVVEEGTIAGVVTQHDLRRAPATAQVREVMSAPAVTATPLTTVRRAANLMRGNHLSCLPVVDERGRLAGMVTASDLLDLIGKGGQREQVDAARHHSFTPGR